MFRKMDPDSINNLSRQNKQLVSLGYKPEDEVIVQVEEDTKQAARNAGYNVTVLYSNDSVDVQLEQVRNARESGIKGIIINLVTPESAPAILEAAGNMKVIFLAHVPADMSILNKNAIYIGADQKQAGRLQGEWLAKHFKGRGMNEFRYIFLQGVKLPISRERTEAVFQTLAENGVEAIPAIPPIIAYDERAQAREQLIPILRSGVKFDAIISNDDNMALGAIEALEEVGMNPAKTVVVGIGATEPALQALVDGKLDFTAYQNRKKRAAATIKAMDNMLNGRSYDAGIEALVSKENPYAMIYPYEPVTRYQIPADLILSF